MILLGEYITIYQYQRQQIKKRMEEKESQLQTVSREREELKGKLQKLQTLVTSFMGKQQQQQQQQTAAAGFVTPPAISSTGTDLNII